MISCALDMYIQVRFSHMKIKSIKLVHDYVFMCMVCIMKINLELIVDDFIISGFSDKDRAS